MIELEPKGKIFVGFLICLVVVAFMSTRSTDATLPEGVYIDGKIPGTTTGFYRIPPQNVEELINLNPSIVIVDCNPGGSDFITGKKLPNAVWSPDYKIYLGQHMTLVLYSTPDDYALEYARELVGKMYGQIYVLTGGYQAWNSWINR